MIPCSFTVRRSHIFEGWLLHSLKKKLTFCFNQSEALPRSEKPRHVISMEFLWPFLGCHFTRKTVGGVGKLSAVFFRLIQSGKYNSHMCIHALINNTGIAKILYGGSLCNEDIHVMTCFGCEVSSERGTSLQNSCIDDSHSKRAQICCLFQPHCGLYKNCWWKYFDTKPFSTKWAFKRWFVAGDKHRGKKRSESSCYYLLFLPIQVQSPSQTAPLKQGLTNIHK